MRKVVASEFVSLDGVMEAPGGGEEFDLGGWSFKFDRGDDGDRFKLDEVMEAEAMLLGRVTYQGFAAAWPSMTDQAGFAEKMNGMPKYVVSSTLEEADWNNSTVIGGNVAEAVSDLKRRPGGDILVAGSAQLVGALREHGLVDEYRLMVFPIVLGRGKRLFGDTGETTTLKLTDQRPVGSEGVVVLTYEPA